MALITDFDIPLPVSEVSPEALVLKAGEDWLVSVLLEALAFPWPEVLILPLVTLRSLNVKKEN